MENAKKSFEGDDQLAINVGLKARCGAMLEVGGRKVFIVSIRNVWERLEMKIYLTVDQSCGHQNIQHT